MNCEYLRKYSTRLSAWADLRAIKARSGQTWGTYKCKTCGAWHIGPSGTRVH